MTDDEIPEIEVSPLSVMVTEDGFTVEVQIYRIAGRGDGWTLDVVSEDGDSTVWDDPFETDADALAEFRRALKQEGIVGIIGDQPTVH